MARRRDRRGRRGGRELDLLLAPQAAREVPHAGRHLPRALPGVRARLHGLHRLHQLRHGAQRLEGAGGLVAHGLVARAGARTRRPTRSRSSTGSASSACSSPIPTARRASARTTSRSPVDAEMEGGKAVAVDGWTTLSFADVLARTDEITELAVPFSDDPNDGALRTPDGSSAYLYVSTLEYDAAAGTMTDVTTGTVYSDIGTGAFTSDDGERAAARLADHGRLRQLRARRHRPATRAARSSTSRSGPSRSRSSRSRRRSSSASSSRSSSTTCACAAASTTAC